MMFATRDKRPELWKRIIDNTICIAIMAGIVALMVLTAPDSNRVSEQSDSNSTDATVESPMK